MKDDDKVYVGKYYELTDEDKELITKAFDNSDLEDLMGFCEALAMVASFNAWDWAKEYLKEVGYNKFFYDCSNCDKVFDCAPMFALYICGSRSDRWVPMTLQTEQRYKRHMEEIKKECEKYKKDE